MLLNPLVIIISLLFFVFQIATIGLCIYGLVSLYATDEITYSASDKEKGYPFPQFSFGILKIIKIPFFIVGMYWVVAYWNNFCDFTVAGAAVNYYYKEKSIIYNSFFTGLSYHLGTIAFASLIMLPISIINFLFGWIYDLATDDQENCVQTCANKTLFCCCWPYEKFFVKTGEGAFGMTYMTSLNFCPSTKKDFYLKRRIEDDVGGFSLVGTIYSITGRLFIALIPPIVCYLLLTNMEYFTVRVSSPIFPCIVIFLISLAVSTLIMNMFSTANEAILMCYMIQRDTSCKIFHKGLSERVDKAELARKQDNPTGYNRLNN